MGGMAFGIGEIMRNKETARVYSKVDMLKTIYILKEEETKKKLDGEYECFTKHALLISEQRKYKEIQDVLDEILKEFELAQEEAVEEAQERKKI